MSGNAQSFFGMKFGRGRDKIHQFMAISGANEKAALAALKASNWNLDGALDIYYYNLHVAGPKLDPCKLEQLFLRYKDSQCDMILAEGICLFCEDIEVDPGDVVMLVISFHMKATTMCEWTKQEFIQGLQSIGVDTTSKLSSSLSLLRAELNDECTFREIYMFAFVWAREKGQKSLALDTAIQMWELLLENRHWPLLKHWCQFLQTNHNKAISKDTWAQLLEFSKTVSPSLANYDAEGAWPYLIDEFVEYLARLGDAAK